jgi:two-component system response regulator YesN
MLAFLERINQIIEANYHDDSLKASNLHSHLQMSRSSLHYKLKKHLRLSTAQYLSHFRINKAKILLSQTNESIKMIAFQVGFKDPNYFCRVFKKETGLAPREFRRISQNEQ